jgi:hypothetical protein
LQDAIDRYADLPSTVEGVDVVVFVDAISGNFTLDPGMRDSVGPDGSGKRFGSVGFSRENRLTAALRIWERMPYEGEHHRGKHCSAKKGTLWW